MAETKAAKAARRRSMKEYHLREYRSARRAVALRAMRLEPVPDSEQRAVAFHAIGVAEIVDLEEAANG